MSQPRHERFPELCDWGGTPFDDPTLLTNDDWRQCIPKLQEEFKKWGGMGVILYENKLKALDYKSFVLCGTEWHWSNNHEQADYVWNESESVSTEVFMDGELWNMVIRKEWQWFDYDEWSEDNPDEENPPDSCIFTDLYYNVDFYKKDDFNGLSVVKAGQIFFPADRVNKSRLQRVRKIKAAKNG